MTAAWPSWRAPDHVGLVFSSLLPVNNCAQAAKPPHAPRLGQGILAVNRWLKAHCNQNALVFLDCYPAMVDERGMLKRELSDGRLHPDAFGYKIMAPLAERAIETALAHEP